MAPSAVAYGMTATCSMEMAVMDDATAASDGPTSHGVQEATRQPLDDILAIDPVWHKRHWLQLACRGTKCGGLTAATAGSS
jgi:hypothetical protein